MMRTLCVLALITAFLAPSALAQKPAPHRKSAHKKAVQKTSQAALPAHTATVVIDTPAAQTPVAVSTPAASDTVRKDTTVLEKVADVVHDSVKAQIKAPIVQVPIRLKTLIIPGALFAYGAVTLNNGDLRIFNEETKEALWDGNKHGRPYIEDYLLLVPAAAVYVLNIAGIKGQNNLVDRSVLYGMSNLIANGLVFGIKYLGVETRPDSSDNHSFPSGHTAEAFVSAEFLHQEYKGRIHWSVVASGYAVATGVAYLRLYHNKHWLSDVVAGAGVGIASTRFSYYLYPIIKHALFGSKKVRESAMIMPTYQIGGGYGLALSYRF